jgi:hypothetical protein
VIRGAATVVFVSSVAVFAVACSAAPTPASEGEASSAAITTTCSNPLNYKQSSTTVSGDVQDGTTPHKSTVQTCVSGTSIPSPPDGGYGENAVTSCVGMVAVSPPADLANLGCTNGYRILMTDKPCVREMFLCPSGITLPGTPATATTVDSLSASGPVVLTSSSLTDPGTDFHVPGGTTAYGWYHNPTNGCFGPSSDPTNYDLVFYGYTPPGNPMNCGANCPIF